MRNVGILVLAIAVTASTGPVAAIAAPTLKPFPIDTSRSLLVEPDVDSIGSSDDAVSSLDEVDAEEEALLDGTLLEAMSVPCEPGVVRSASREALEALLAGTPADLRGTQYRAPWFQAFPDTQSFPEAADASAALWRWSELGTVGKVRSTSPWPLWQNPGAPPTDDAGREALARLFLVQQRRLILYRPAVDTLEVIKVVTGVDGGFTVFFGQTYQQLQVLQARVMVRCDVLGDVFSMQSFFVPNLAVDTVPTVPASELWEIVMASGNPVLAGGAFDFSRGPELVVMHTNLDFCSGSLMWDFDVIASTGETFSYLVDAHRGTVHGWAPLDLEDADHQKLFNLYGNHPRQGDVTDCFDGTQDCHWFSNLDEAMTDADVQADWPVPAVVIAADPDLGRFRCSQKCSEEGGADCAVPPDLLWTFPDPAATGRYKTAYDSTDPLGDGDKECPGFVSNDPNNPWSQSAWNNPPSGDQRYHPCRWIVDDLGEIEAWVADMSAMLGADSATTSNDLFADVPDVEVLASEPIRTATVAGDPRAFFFTPCSTDGLGNPIPSSGWEPWRDDDLDYDNDHGLGIGQRQYHFPHFPLGSSYFSVGGGWGGQHILLSAPRYDYLDHAGPDPGNCSIVDPEHSNLGVDDTLYHEMGHYLYNGVPGGHYISAGLDSTSPFNSADPAACVLWRGIYTETGADLMAAILEYRRWKAAHDLDPNTPDRPDWMYGEGLRGSGRDMQRPDGEDRNPRHPESLNDFHIVTEPGEGDTFAGEHESEIHTTSGAISRFYFLMGNDICDVDNGCGAGSDALSNAGHCSCWSDVGGPATQCVDDATPVYNRSQEKWHTINPPDSCKHQQPDTVPGTPGFQQWHNGVEVTALDTSLDPTLPEDGLERLGRIHARMLYQADVDTFTFTPTMPQDFMDAFFSATIEETGWTWPDPFGAEEVSFYRARDAVGFWTPIGNYFENLDPDVAAEGITAAMVNWGPDPSNPAQAWNSEWLFGFNPDTHRIGLLVRPCWNQDHDGDGDMDYCFASAPWSYFVADWPSDSGWFIPLGVPSLDVNDAGDAALDTNHGLWIVYRAVGGPNPGICRKMVPVFPNQGYPSTRQCDWTRATNFRPGAGHALDTATSTTREVVVFADANDGDQLKSFEWGIASSIRTIPIAGQCAPISPWRPEVVTHGGFVWALWTGAIPGSGQSALCYSRYVHDAAPSYWEAPKAIPFEGEITSCGDNSRVLAGPPSATVRNGIVNVAVRDRDLATGDMFNGESWVWMIQLADIDPPGFAPANGEFWECNNTPECAGSCSADCGGRDLWEERSPWVPHAEFDATLPEIGPLTTTQHLRSMATTSTGQRQDYTFFYNPTQIQSLTAVLPADMSVWVRESW